MEPRHNGIIISASVYVDEAARGSSGLAAMEATSVRPDMMNTKPENDSLLLQSAAIAAFLAVASTAVLVVTAMAATDSIFGGNVFQWHILLMPIAFTLLGPLGVLVWRVGARLGIDPHATMGHGARRTQQEQQEERAAPPPLARAPRTRPSPPPRPRVSIHGIGTGIAGTAPSEARRSPGRSGTRPWNGCGGPRIYRKANRW